MTYQTIVGLIVSTTTKAGLKGHRDIYGIFTYGMNKCETLKSNALNLFHTGILSHEFKLLIEKEKECREHEEKGDVYVTDTLRRAWHYHSLRERKTSK